jgi:hypothetical protein
VRNVKLTMYLQRMGQTGSVRTQLSEFKESGCQKTELWMEER